jgi:hypothetical protein
MYERCKCSVAEFKDFSGEVMSMHIVLEAIEQHWKDEEELGNDLSANHKDELAKLSGSREEALKDLDALLNKHQALGNERLSEPA